MSRGTARSNSSIGLCLRTASAAATWAWRTTGSRAAVAEIGGGEILLVGEEGVERMALPSVTGEKS